MMGLDIKIGDRSKKTFLTVMGTWHKDSSQTLKMGEKQDDEETWGLEGGYRHKTDKSFWQIKRILQYRFNVTVVFLLYLTRQT